MLLGIHVEAIEVQSEEEIFQMRLVASLDKLGDHCRERGGDETGEEGREEREKVI